MKTQVLHTVWCNITSEAAGGIWTWSLLGVKGLSRPLLAISDPVVASSILFDDVWTLRLFCSSFPELSDSELQVEIVRCLNVPLPSGELLGNAVTSLWCGAMWVALETNIATRCQLPLAQTHLHTRTQYCLQDSNSPAMRACCSVCRHVRIHVLPYPHPRVQGCSDSGYGFQGQAPSVFFATQCWAYQQNYHKWWHLMSNQAMTKFNKFSFGVCRISLRVGWEGPGAFPPPTPHVKDQVAQKSLCHCLSRTHHWNRRAQLFHAVLREEKQDCVKCSSVFVLVRAHCTETAEIRCSAVRSPRFWLTAQNDKFKAVLIARSHVCKRQNLAKKLNS